MITAQEVVTDAVPCGDKRDIKILNVDDRATLLPIGGATLIRVGSIA
jgi:hypothetical protein